ncbi:MAG: serine/threonine protein kinase, partial [Deltaproteobacteria bacterium]|nr:serine/threonine protein kinase [Nannocystaceae bacterium]
MVERTHVLSTSEGSATPVAQPAPPPRSAAKPSPFHAGMVLGERYRLVAPLGKGGMGEVWEVVHVVIGRSLALKVVLGEGNDPELAQRLQREAELVARLEHANIVGVTDFGLVAANQPFVVMERLHGRTLAELLRGRGPLPWSEARDIAVQIAAGLACAHQAGIVHRDLKPSNVFVLDDAQGRLRIKIIDFGLAKATVIGPGDRALTMSGAVFGSPAYMAPEQVRGEAIDPRTDLYALGAILYEMIVGERLWTRPSIPALLYCQLFEPAPTIRARVPEVPIELDV